MKLAKRFEAMSDLVARIGAVGQAVGATTGYLNIGATRSAVEIGAAMMRPIDPVAAQQTEASAPRSASACVEEEES